MKRAFDLHRNLGSLVNAFFDAHPEATPQSTSLAELLVWSYTRVWSEEERAALHKVHLFGREVERGEA